MKLINQNKKFDLRRYYTIFFELGLIGALSIFLIATNIRIVPGGNELSISSEKEEIVSIKEVVRTKQKKVPPPPPPPQVPVAVPNDQVIEEEFTSFDSELDFDEPIPMPQEIVETETKKKEEVEEEIFVAVEQMPELIGTQADLLKKIVYPKKAAEANIQGRVVVQFVIDKEGRVTDPVVIRGIGGGCDEEAVRVAKLARFKPGRQRGEPVPVRYSLPFMFTLKQR